MIIYNIYKTDISSKKLSKELSTNISRRVEELLEESTTLVIRSIDIIESGDIEELLEESTNLDAI